MALLLSRLFDKSMVWLNAFVHMQCKMYVETRRCSLEILRFSKYSGGRAIVIMERYT
jgi:hypothetical protein